MESVYVEWPYRVEAHEPQLVIDNVSKATIYGFEYQFEMKNV